jgi:hypothetical protein
VGGELFGHSAQASRELYQQVGHVTVPVGNAKPNVIPITQLIAGFEGWVVQQG